MPLFMDVHHMDEKVSAADVAKAHQADVATQDQYGVDYQRYWVDEAKGKIFCLVQAPDADTATPCTARRTGSWPTRSTRSARAPDDAQRRYRLVAEKVSQSSMSRPRSRS